MDYFYVTSRVFGVIGAGTSRIRVRIEKIILIAGIAARVLSPRRLSTLRLIRSSRAYSSRILMPVLFKRAVLSLVAGSVFAIAPAAFATVVAPAISHADQCNDAQGNPNGQSEPCAAPAKGLNCPDGTIVDEKNAQCVSLTAGITKQLQALPAPPSLSGFGGGGGGGLGGLGKIPSLGTINLPDVVLPSLGLNLVPNVNLNLQPRLPVFNPLNLP